MRGSPIWNFLVYFFTILYNAFWMLFPSLIIFIFWRHFWTIWITLSLLVNMIPERQPERKYKTIRLE